MHYFLLGVSVLILLYGAMQINSDDIVKKDHITKMQLKKENCKKFKVLETSLFFEPEYLYKCDAGKQYRLNKDYDL
ncbi:MAG: hypothetical protein AB7V48_16165 [Sedimentibacter sp.]